MFRLPVPHPMRGTLTQEENRVATLEIRERLERLGFALGNVLNYNQNRGRVVLSCGPNEDCIAKIHLQGIYAPFRHRNRPENEIRAHMELATSTVSPIIPRGIASDHSAVVMERILGVSLPEYIVENSDSAIDICGKVIDQYIQSSRELGAVLGHIDVYSLASAEVNELWRVAFQSDAPMSRILAHRFATPLKINRDCLKAIVKLSVSAQSNASSLFPVFACRDLFVHNILVAGTYPKVVDWDNAGATFLEFEISLFVASVVGLFLQVGLMHEASKFISVIATKIRQAEEINFEVYINALSVYLAAMQINPTLWNTDLNPSLTYSFIQRYGIVRRLRVIRETVEQ